MSWRRLLSGEVISINQVTLVVRTVIAHIHFTMSGYYCFVPLPGSSFECAKAFGSANMEVSLVLRR